MDGCLEFRYRFSFRTVRSILTHCQVEIVQWTLFTLYRIHVNQNIFYINFAVT